MGPTVPSPPAGGRRNAVRECRCCPRAARQDRGTVRRERVTARTLHGGDAVPEEPGWTAAGAAAREQMTDQPLHPLLAQRWSPTMFDESHEAQAVEVESLLEAARWAPSAGNSQPWAFL